MTTNIRVKAVEGRKLQALDGEGAPRPGRYVGYDRRGEIDPAGASVPADAYYLRAVKNGDLVLAEEAD